MTANVAQICAYATFPGNGVRIGRHEPRNHCARIYSGGGLLKMSLTTAVKIVGFGEI